ncbi:deoxyguanosinetriphosphate triphosphohydrolase [Candidatus Peregrinibacteria bacterium CG10_big_fil_rev_8_21_14_0_10_42_8]|nr:MAG: deoxyguanosinetriphosphate triphosphohydrolase [Candidatus Peregrinibacteria bacterium CG10_big_fil_rev_8_21_14_0_10_42_8]
MKNLEVRMAKANELLEPYAVPHEGTLGRVHKEENDATRFSFQRDIDRVQYSDEFRRLKGKTQVFVGGRSDHYRTRLTHTIEVARVSRNITRTLGLNEDLAECIALAHDLGHPPFGHSGEDALNQWMKSHNMTFEHNQQSLRIVEFLSSQSPLFRGLNLNREVLHGLMKHRTPHDNPTDTTIELPSMEALAVNLADEIAYTCHDVDDGMREGLFDMKQLMKIPLIEACYTPEKKLGSSLTHVLISDLYEATEQQIDLQQIATFEDVYTKSDQPVRFSDDMRTQLKTLRQFLYQNMYFHPSVLDQVEAGKATVLHLCQYLSTHPTSEVLALQKRSDSTIIEAVKDYVSGMTDHYATEVANRLNLSS